MNVPPIFGRRIDIPSAISVAGVMGYPAKKRQPAAMAPSTTASFPWMRTSFAAFVLIGITFSFSVNAFLLDFYLNGKIRATNLTKTAADAGIRIFHNRKTRIIPGKNGLGAEFNADAASFAPVFKYLDLIFFFFPLREAGLFQFLTAFKTNMFYSNMQCVSTIGKRIHC